MKINDSKNSAASLGLDKALVDKAPNEQADAKLDKAASNAEAKSADSVTLSPMAKQIKSLQSKIATESVFDADKVNEIKSAIASGQFKVDTGKVADGLIQSVKEMLSNRAS